MSGSMKPHIFLVYPSAFHVPLWMDRIGLKTSLIWLGSYLNRYFPVTFADYEKQIGRPNTSAQIRRFERRVRRDLAEREFDILALSCWTSLSYQATCTVARICRELYPERLIVVGGYHASARPHDFFLKEQIFDFVVSGEGELALREIAGAYAAEGRPRGTQFIKGPMVTEEHFVPHGWEIARDSLSEYLQGEVVDYMLYLSRGCPFSCSFCMEPSKDRRWRAFPPAEAIEELYRTVGFFKTRGISIADACFGMRPSWRKEFLRRLVEREPEFGIVFETRPEYLDAEDIELLSHLKTEIQFGVESCSHDMLRLMQKTRRPEKFLSKFREVSHQLSERKILHRANLIFNHPGETRRTVEETWAFIDRELKQRDTYLIWATHGYMHFPGCDIDRRRDWYEEQFGAKFPCGDWWRDETDQYESSMRVVPSSDFSDETVNLWEEMEQERQHSIRAALAPEAFRYAALKYFREWQSDPRFRIA